MPISSFYSFLFTLSEKHKRICLKMPGDHVFSIWVQDAKLKIWTWVEHYTVYLHKGLDSNKKMTKKQVFT